MTLCGHSGSLFVMVHRGQTKVCVPVFNNCGMFLNIGTAIAHDKHMTVKIQSKASKALQKGFTGHGAECVTNWEEDSLNIAQGVPNNVVLKIITRCHYRWKSKNSEVATAWGPFKEELIGSAAASLIYSELPSVTPTIFVFYIQEVLPITATWCPFPASQLPLRHSVMTT